MSFHQVFPYVFGVVCLFGYLLWGVKIVRIVRVIKQERRDRRGMVYMDIFFAPDRFSPRGRALIRKHLLNFLSFNFSLVLFASFLVAITRLFDVGR